MTSGAPRIGWVLDTSARRVFPLPWDRMSSVAQIRYAGIAKHLSRTTDLRIELYRPWRRYDVLVFVKIMSDPAFALAEKMKRLGTRVIFDANVNYYESWGDFIIPGTKPTAQQEDQARRMTRLADLVVADSSYLMDLCKTINPNTFFIPDAVDTDYFKPLPKSVKDSSGPITLIWSGIGKKAYHLEMIEPVLQQFRDSIRLILVPSAPTSYDPPAAVLERLKSNLRARVVYWNYSAYRDLLREANLVISPKHLSSSYEMAHTEYKITLAMAMGLPVLASPQRSYVEVLGDGRGGRICENPEQWEQALKDYLADRTLLAEQGKLARQNVLDRYSIPVVAKQYEEVLRKTCAF